MEYFTKKITGLLFLLIGCNFIFSQQITIPDANFEQALIELNFDTDGEVNGMISQDNAAKIKVLTIPSRNINSLQGIELFPNLEELYCNNNSLTVLDVSSNIKLRVLNCNNNALQDLDLQSNDALDILLAENNALQNLNLRNENRSVDGTPFVTSSVYGIIKDEHNVPVIGAIVTYAGNITISNAIGFYNFDAISSPETGLPLSVYHREINGGLFGKVYFKRTVMFSPQEGKDLEVNIKLARKTEVASIDAQSGGNAMITEGQMISFPEGSVVDRNGEVYSGEFKVFAQYINPENSDFSEELPGFLIGASESGDGEQGLLRSFGMFQVEIEKPDGSPLNLAPDKSATLSTQLPKNLLDAAPATIPMWFLDESTGLWKEEGISTLDGDTYVAEVPHFTTWNWDDVPCTPTRIVKIFGTVISESAFRDHVMSGVKVTASFIDCNGFSPPSKTTDVTGFFQFNVPSGVRVSLTFSVLPNSCSSGGSLSSFITGPFASKNNDLGRVGLALPVGYITGEVTADFVDTNNRPVEDVAVFLLRSRTGSNRVGAAVRAIGGSVSVSSAECQDDSSINQLIAYDLSDASNILSSDPVAFDFIDDETFDLGNIVVGNGVSNLGAGEGSLEYIKFNMDGAPRAITNVFSDETNFEFNALQAIRGNETSDDGEVQFFSLSSEGALDEDPIGMLTPAINSKGQFFSGNFDGVEFRPERDPGTGDRIPNATSQITWRTVLPESKYNYEDICDTSGQFQDSSEYFLVQGNFTMEATDINGVEHTFTEGAIQIVFDRNGDYGALENCSP